MAKSAARDVNDLSGFLITGAAGDVLYKEGDEAADVFIIEDGRVELVRESAGASPVVETLSRGDVFGEDVLSEGQVRSTSARALTDFQALRIDRPTFERILIEDPAIGLSLARRLATSLRKQRDAVGRVSQAPSRRSRPEVDAPPLPSKRPDVPTLHVLGSELALPLAERELTVGRIDKATGRTPDVDLTDVDTERSLSRKHARILFRDGRYYVRAEPGARNGTFVNGNRLADGEEAELSHGTRLRFGLVETAFTTPA